MNRIRVFRNNTSIVSVLMICENYESEPVENEKQFYRTALIKTELVKALNFSFGGGPGSILVIFTFHHLDLNKFHLLTN